MPRSRAILFAASLAALAARTVAAGVPTTPAPATPAVATPKAIADKLAEFKTADELWAHFQALQRGPRGQGTTPEARAKAFQEFVTEVCATGERFVALYPADPRRWEARLTAARLSQRVAKGKSQAEVEQLYREAAAAPDAPVEIKARARLGLIQMHREGVKEDTPKEKVTALDAEIVAFANDFPKNDALPELQTARAALWEKRDAARSLMLLEELARGANPEVARQAAAQLRFRNIRKQPLALKFTALDGSEVDLEQMRGKVVLIDYWATTNGPCVADTPTKIATYEKLHDKGFEIVGISLDSDKERLLKFINEKNLPWPQYFDGKAFRNAISSSFAIRSIPAMWLINKEGYVVSTDARGELEELVTKQLAE
ncbi:MAG: hypothetical protein QOE70_2803 [Chthoniobacter sp.]|jgi:thiol-disulfide isomerase/thioredoxin|nr:hypothetical protein [Chthoniobacter sp.]